MECVDSNELISWPHFLHVRVGEQLQSLLQINFAEVVMDSDWNH